MNTILVTRNDSHFQADAASLHATGIKVSNRFSFGPAALDYLRYNPVRMIVLDTEMNGCTAVEFLRTLKEEFLLRDIPVLVISSDSSEEFVLGVVSAGCAGFLIRPYTSQTLMRSIRAAGELTRFNEIEEEQIRNAEGHLNSGRFDQAIESYNELIAAEDDQAQHYFDLGMDYLGRHQYGKAIIAFSKALKVNRMFIQAFKGLAEAYKGKGDIENCQLYLQRAADEYARIDQYQVVKDLFAEIVKIDRYAPNPYNTLGIDLRRKGMYEQAITAYAKAMELDPEDENISFNMAKALFHKGDRRGSLQYAVRCLALNRAHEQAQILFHSISGEEWAPGLSPQELTRILEGIS
jgi:tetratricopeptide (TPR) repeat protein